MEVHSVEQEAQLPALGSDRLPVYMPPEEMYKVTRGIAGEWGIEGYEVPCKAILYGKEKHTFAKSLRKTQSEERLKVQGEIPAPGMYDPKVKFELKSKTHRPVFKAPRNTYIDAVFKAPKLPGPGQYFPTDRNPSKPEAKKVRGAAIGLSSGLNYLSTCEFYGQESPGPGAYFQEAKGMKLAKTASEKPSHFFRSPAAPKSKDKDLLGPGTYYTKDYVENIKSPLPKLYRDPIRTSVPRPIMPKSTPTTSLEVHARLTKFVPGVGFYENATKPLDGFVTDPKKIRLALNKEKGTRFPEDVIKSRTFTVGPAKYNPEDDEDELKKKR